MARYRRVWRWRFSMSLWVAFGIAPAATAFAAHTSVADSSPPNATVPQLRPPWFMDCSNNPRYSHFRETYVDLRRQFPEDDWENEEFVSTMTKVLLEANELGGTHQEVFLRWANSWDIYLLCNDDRLGEVPQDLQINFCFYGFAIVQWLGVYAYMNFDSTTTHGMDEWARHGYLFVNDAAQSNSMHFLDSSGWPVKLEEMMHYLGLYVDRMRGTHARSSEARTIKEVASPVDVQGGAAMKAKTATSPVCTRESGVRRVKAVAVSYHTALVREPLVLWHRMLHGLFSFDVAVHILDTSARTVEDVRRLHAHCRFADGVWCAADERLLELNKLMEESLLSCNRPGDHKTRHQFITDIEAYHQLFVSLLGNDPGFESADLFICGEPVYFCRLLAYFGRPVVGYISTPLSVAVNAADRTRWFDQFHVLASDPLNVFVVTTPIFGEMIRYATGIALPVIRPACLYTEASYWPVRSRDVLMLRTVSIFWDSVCVLNYFAHQAADEGKGAERLIFHESTSLSEGERVGYGTFAEFLGVVIFPYAFSQFWFYEFYAMGMPLFLPSPATIPLYIYQDYAACSDFHGQRSGHVPEDVHPFSPFDRTGDAMKHWSAFTDFVLLPHVNYFESVPELLVKLESGDLRAQSEKMKQVHISHLGLATTFWQGALERALFV